MSDPLAKTQEKLQDGNRPSSRHEPPPVSNFPRRLPSLARTATSRKRRVQIRQGAPGLRQPQDSPISRSRMGDSQHAEPHQYPKDRSATFAPHRAGICSAIKRSNTTLVSSEEPTGEGPHLHPSPIGKALPQPHGGDEIEWSLPRARKNLNRPSGHHSRRRVTFWAVPGVLFNKSCGRLLRTMNWGTGPALAA